MLDLPTAASLLARPRWPLERLAAADARPPAGAIDWTPPIDRSRPFFCETLTPLFYTRVYRELGPEHRLRYNQLTGMLANEFILLLETELLSLALRSLARAADGPLAGAIAQFAQDEQRHADTWRRLNRLSDPSLYAATDHALCRLPPALRTLSGLLARHPTTWPVMLWVQLSQEERSIEISRRCVRLPPDRIEPRYAAAYREHVQDEVRHVQIDCHLIERFYASRPRAVRRLTATVFRTLIASFFLRPVHSTASVVRRLAADYPELQPMLPRMLAELGQLHGDDDFQRMMYSRETTPILFAWFDRFDEFHSMSRVLRGYTARPAGSLA